MGGQNPKYWSNLAKNGKKMAKKFNNLTLDPERGAKNLNL